MSDLTVEKLQTNIYKFNENGEEMNVDAFLIIGEKKAIMIDGLMKAKGVLAEVKKLTDLPLEMIIAHGHPGHTVQIPDYRGDGEGYIDLTYVEDLMEVTTDLITGKKKGKLVLEASELMKGVDVCVVSGKIMGEYTYDRQKIQ